MRQNELTLVSCKIDVLLAELAGAVLRKDDKDIAKAIEKLEWQKALLLAGKFAKEGSKLFRELNMVAAIDKRAKMALSDLPSIIRRNLERIELDSFR